MINTSPQTQTGHTGLNDIRQSSSIKQSNTQGFDRKFSSTSAQSRSRSQREDDRAFSISYIKKANQRRNTVSETLPEETRHTQSDPDTKTADLNNHRDNTANDNRDGGLSHHSDNRQDTSHTETDTEPGIDSASIPKADLDTDEQKAAGESPDNTEPTTEQVLLANLPTQGLQSISSTTGTSQTDSQQSITNNTQTQQQQTPTLVDGQVANQPNGQQNPLPTSYAAAENIDALSGIDSSSSGSFTESNDQQNNQSSKNNPGNANHNQLLNPTNTQTTPGTDQILAKMNLDSIGLKDISVENTSPNNHSTNQINENHAPAQTTGTPPITQANSTPATQGLQFGPDPDSNETNPNVARVVRGLRGVINQNGGTVTIRLDPPELGAVRVQMLMGRGTVSVDIHTAHESVRTLLSHQLGQLRHMLETQGLAVDKLQVQSSSNETFDFLSEQQTKEAPDDGHSQGQYTQQDDEEQSEDTEHEQDSAFDHVLNTVA